MGKAIILALGAVGLFMYYQHQKKQKAKLRPQQQQQQLQYQQQAPPPQQGGGHHYGTMAAGAAGVAALGYYATQHHSGGGAQGGGAVNPQEVLRILKETVRDQKLSGFFHGNLDHALQPLADKVARSGAIEYLAREWDLPFPVALDFCKLALFDVVLYLDDSGSMSFEENGRRIDDLKLIVSKVAEAASLFDQNGIQVRFMNAHIEGNGITNEHNASALLNRIEYKYQTPLGTALKKRVLDPLVLEPAKHGRLPKPVLIIAVTDGEPGGEDRGTLVHVISKANKELQKTKYGPDAVSFQLAQVGSDRRARDFLSEIDTHREIGHLVDVTSNYEFEAEQMANGNPPIQLTAILWLVKLLLGGIDSTYDGADERGGKMKSRLAAASAMQDYAYSDSPSYQAAPPSYPQQMTSPAPASYGQQYPPANSNAYPAPNNQQYPPPTGQYPPQNAQQGYGQPQTAYGQQSYPPQNGAYPPQNGGYPQQSRDAAYPPAGGAGFANTYGGAPDYGGGGYPAPPSQGDFYSQQQQQAPMGGGFAGGFGGQPQGPGGDAWIPSMPNPPNQGYQY